MVSCGMVLQASLECTFRQLSNADYVSTLLLISDLKLRVRKTWLLRGKIAWLAELEVIDPLGNQVHNLQCGTFGTDADHLPHTFSLC